MASIAEICGGTLLCGVIMEVLKLENVNVVFPVSKGEKLEVLKDINFSVSDGKVVSLLGPSGCGKSTLLRVITGLLEPNRGSVLYRGEPQRGVNEKMAMVFQNFALFPWKTVWGNIAVGIKDPDVKNPDKMIERAIDMVGLEGFEEVYPKNLSGGMKQRVGIARALVSNPEVLCMDEPFSALDVLTAENLREELLDLWLAKKTSLLNIIIVTHNITEAVYMSDEIVIMSSNPGRVQLVYENRLPYPRDPNSPQFLKIVEVIRNYLTRHILPDLPEGKIYEQLLPLPNVTIGEVIGLLEILEDNNGKMDLFSLSERINRTFSVVMLIATAAEFLGFVETPLKYVVLTKLGKRFLDADINERKEIFRIQLLKLPLVKEFVRFVRSSGGSVDSEEAREFLSRKLPNERPSDLLKPLLDFCLYAEILDYDSKDDEISINPDVKIEV